MLENLLGEQGFDTDISDSFKTSMAFINTEVYDLICVNQYLADGSGAEFVKFCNEHDTNSQTPILFFTNEKEYGRLKSSLNVSDIIVKSDLNRISNQITRFVESIFDPVFYEGRILFVEDSASIADVIVKKLARAGYQTKHFFNGEDAWIEFEKELSFGSSLKSYDLVITDITLTGKMTGTQLIKNIRSLGDARGFVPIIAITGDNSDDLRLALYQNGINDFLQKPFIDKEFLVRIKNLVTNKRLLDKVHNQRRDLFLMATTDKLTGCSNRHSLMDFSDKFISQAILKNYPISLMVIDLDNFKLVNDTHGHAIGDIVLVAIGKLLNRSFREGDLVARFGGEEFVVLLNNCDVDHAKEVAESLRQKIERLMPGDIEIAASFGLTTMEVGQQSNFDNLFYFADKGVYRAKENGRNCVVYEPLVSPLKNPNQAAIGR